jgi:serine/threonine protein kinase
MPTLRVRSGPQSSQNFILRPPGPFRLGRDLAADFPLFDRNVSRAHFTIDFFDEGYRLRDLNSKSGTFVNDSRVDTAILSHGDRIQVGRLRLSFALDDPEDALVGREIGGYRILERVGTSDMGAVYRAVQLCLNRIVALKVAADRIAENEDYAAVFVAEARTAVELFHQNIARVYDVNRLDGTLFYVTEYMAQGTVAGLLRREGALPVGRALDIAAAASAGLEYAARKGLVHRDIKPSNLLIHETGTIKISELGPAMRTLTRGNEPSSQGISGSAHYMAPEQAADQAFDSQADVYALGASLYEVLSGTPPFSGKTVKELALAHRRELPPDIALERPDVPPSLAATIQDVMSKAPSSRPTAGSLRRSLESIPRDAPQSSLMPTREPRGWRPVVLLCILAAAFFGLGSLGSLVFHHLGGVMHDRSERLERVRQTITDGRQALHAGDIDTAMEKVQELSELLGSQEEWAVLEDEIKKFETEVKGRRN